MLDQPHIGPTGKSPHGKCRPDDQGELDAAVGHLQQRGRRAPDGRLDGDVPIVRVDDHVYVPTWRLARE